MASAQTHRIQRQVIELAGCRRGDATALQAAAARLSQRDWSPLIERVCSARVAAGRVLRIDRLQVDLGEVPAADWLAAAAGEGEGRDATAAQALARQFEAAFEARLGEALREASEVQTDSELLTFFLQSGALPWWADVADRSCVARAAVALAPQPVAAWRQWLGQPGAAEADHARLGRLVAALSDPQLSDLLQRWLPAAADDGWTPAQQIAWRSAVERAARALGQPAAAWHRAWWQAAVATALWPAAEGAGWAAMLHRWQASIGVPDAAVQPALRAALDAVASEVEADTDALAPLWRALDPPRDERATRAAGDSWQAALAALGRLAASGAGDAAAWQHLRDRLAGAGPDPEAAPRRSATATAATGEPGRSQPVTTRLPAALLDRVSVAARSGPLAELQAALQALLQAARHQGLIDPVAAGLAGDADRLAQRAAAWAAALRPAASPASPSPGVDALYVHNAGLVLLWPFIQRFADRLGLLQPGKPVRWRDAAAGQRAAVLLHCAISGDAEPPEFQLLLPKLLCGLDLDEPLQLPSPLSADEQAECEALLVAAIAQAPILRQMSVAGFRGSFGLREGQLSSRDGHWLLRVERQTFDVVIDRFPWSAALVRLPWMPALLQVQW